jgi:hypothetical protein
LGFFTEGSAGHDFISPFLDQMCLPSKNIIHRAKWRRHLRPRDTMLTHPPLL